MNQSRIDSVLEAATNILIGGGISLLVTVLWFPVIGVKLSIGQDFATVGVFTLISFLRSYGLRRAFNGRTVYQSLKIYINLRKKNVKK